MIGLLAVAALGCFAQNPSQITLPPAMKFPQKFTAEVVGSPALASTISGAVGRAINMHVKGAKGANFTFNLGTISPLLPGRTEVVTAKVNANAPGCVEAYGKVYISVSCARQTLGSDQFLWFCNAPETIKNPGPLYSNTLQSGIPVRVLYHHICYNLQPAYMRMELINVSSQPGKVVLIAGDSEPSSNPALAGYRAAMQYLPARKCDSGDLITIAPHSKQVIALRRMVAGKAMSGLCSIKLLPGGPTNMTLRADAVPFVNENRFVQLALIDPEPWRFIPNQPLESSDLENLSLNHLTYILPYQVMQAKVDAGGQASDTLIGVEGIPKVGGGRHLNGNFGVVYQYKITLQNPTNSKQAFRFLMRANSGYSAGVFLIYGKVYGVRPETKATTRQFFRMIVPAKSTIQLPLWTVPVSGCCYPASVWIVSGDK